VLYAISDEYHQSFVANRHPQATDVLIDACGAATALLIVALLLQRSKKQTESVISSPLSVVDE
jgi:VanZ family protein